MPTSYEQAKGLLDQVLTHQTVETLKQRLQPFPASRQRPASGNAPEALKARWEAIELTTASREALMGADAAADMQVYRRNIENFVGTVKVPVGLAGPLRVNGLHARGDYLLPLATTEAALVASYNRGTKIISSAGGCTSVLLGARVSRCPCFVFRTLVESGEFLLWVNQQMGTLRERAESTTRHGKLLDLRFSVEGNRVFMSFDYDTADASGQNMVTIATQAVFDYINTHAPVRPQLSFVEANMSGDKKASMQAFQNTRGRKVSCEVVVPRALVEQSLHTTVDTLHRFHSVFTAGGVLSGTLGAQGHYANALAALYIACGQDAACVSESSVGITRFEPTLEGDLYASVTLPNLMVGTVGGGTGLPSQSACLEMMRLGGAGNANALAEVAAGLCLAGELSISAAMCSNTFTQAHENLARHGKECSHG